MHHITSRTVFLWMGAITILLAAEAGFLYYKNIQLESQIKAIQSSQVIPTPAPFTCPANGWVDCMPGPGPAKKGCTPQAMDWYKANCPNFQGGAL